MTVLRNLAERLAETLARSWWALLMRGIVAALFGLAVVFQPGLSLASVLFLFGVFTLADGILAAFTAVTHRDDTGNWTALLASGLAGVVVGLVTLIVPGITVVVVVYMMAAWALVLGVVQIMLAMRLREAINGEWALFATGLATLALGAFMVFRPASGALAAIWIIGCFALLIGVLLTMLAMRLKGVADRLEARLSTRKTAG